MPDPITIKLRCRKPCYIGPIRFDVGDSYGSFTSEDPEIIKHMQFAIQWEAFEWVQEVDDDALVDSDEIVIPIGSGRRVKRKG